MTTALINPIHVSATAEAPTSDRLLLQPSRPRRVVRSEYVQVASHAPTQRSELLSQLFEVYSDTAHGLTLDELAALVSGDGDSRVALFYSAEGEIAGVPFATIGIVEHAGRSHAVFNAGVLFRLGYHGGLSGALFGLRQALRHKLRHPRTPLSYCTRSCTPAAYRLLASTMPRIYPSRTGQTPTYVQALAPALCSQRDYVPVERDSWVARSPGTPNDASRLRGIESDPYAQFYIQLNPCFAEGEALLTWIPLDVANIAGALFRLFRVRSAR